MGVKLQGSSVRISHTWNTTVITKSFQEPEGSREEGEEASVAGDEEKQKRRSIRIAS